MRLTWRDVVATVFTAAIVVIYAAFLNSTTAWLISSARGTATAVLVLGMVGGCGLSAAGAQYQGKHGGAYTAAVSLLGVVALITAVLALITASEVALAVLVGATVALWLVATLRHALAVPASSGGSAHEVIHREKASH